MDLEFLKSLIENYTVLIYGILALICFVEGPILTIICGSLLHLGFFSVIPLYLSLMLGDLFGDVFWYTIGRHLGSPFVTRFGKYFSIEQDEIATVKKIFHKYDNHILIISKVTMGLGFAVVTLFTAGMMRVPFKKYFTLNAVGQIFWTGFLLAVGYWFGNLYTSIEGVLGKISLVAIIIMAFAVMTGFGKYVRKQMTKKSELV